VTIANVQYTRVDICGFLAICTGILPALHQVIPIGNGGLSNERSEDRVATDTRPTVPP
jgi:hypothetical protein